jgi:hypothetical protein
MFNPAPFANDLPYVAAILAWTDNGLPRSLLMSPEFDLVRTALVADDNDTELTEQLNVFFKKIDATQYLDKVTSIVESRRVHLDNFTDFFPNNGHIVRIQGEASSNPNGALGFALGNFSKPFTVNDSQTINIGTGDSISLHGPSLVDLVVRTQNSQQPFGQLFLNDQALRSAFLDPIPLNTVAGVALGPIVGPIAGPVDNGRADPVGSSSRMGASGLSPAIIYRALSKSAVDDSTDPNSFYNQFYVRFGSWLASGTVAEGLQADAPANSEQPSIHTAVVDLGAQVVRDAIVRGPNSGSGASPVISDAGLYVFGSKDNTEDNSAPPPESPASGYVRVDLSDIPGSDNPQLRDPRTRQPYGVGDVGSVVAESSLISCLAAGWNRTRLRGILSAVWAAAPTS